VEGSLEKRGVRGGEEVATKRGVWRGGGKEGG
jgi:hypothetical protein